MDTPQQSTSYPVGSTLTVLHDPANPSTVAWPGSGSGGGRPEIVIGALLLTLLAALAVWSRRPGARQRGRPHTGAGPLLLCFTPLGHRKSVPGGNPETKPDEQCPKSRH